MSMAPHTGFLTTSARGGGRKRTTTVTEYDRDGVVVRRTVTEIEEPDPWPTYPGTHVQPISPIWQYPSYTITC